MHFDKMCINLCKKIKRYKKDMANKTFQNHSREQRAFSEAVVLFCLWAFIGLGFLLMLIAWGFIPASLISKI